MQDKFDRIETDIINITSVPLIGSIMSNETGHDLCARDPIHITKSNNSSISVLEEKKKHQSMISEDSLIQEEIKMKTEEEIKLKNEEQFKEILTEFQVEN